MKIRILSDIHNDHYQQEYGKDFELPVLKDEKDTILIIAGDLCELSRLDSNISFIESLCVRFKSVFWVTGNHEYYSGTLDQIVPVDEYLNLYSHELILPSEKIAIIGETLWTDFDKKNPLLMVQAQFEYSDYDYIFDDKDCRILPEKILSLHNEQKHILSDKCNYYRMLDYKVIIVTHHSPSYQSVDVKYKGDNYNGLYCSELEYMVQNANYWIHGHHHDCCRYKISDCEVICNPAGYFFEGSSFDPLLTINI